MRPHAFVFCTIGKGLGKILQKSSRALWELQSDAQEGPEI